MSQHKESICTSTYHYEPETVDQSPGLKRVAAYCRVSTLTEQQELSFETQCSFYRELIEKDPTMRLVGIYGDQGFSGLRSASRKEYLRLIRDCEKGKVDLILVKSVSRFSRNTVECREYLKKLKDCGVSVWFEKEGLDSLDPRTDMILSIYASLAQSESCSHSESLRWAMKRRAEIGDPIRPASYGYRNVLTPGETTHHWEIDEDEARRVRYMFELAYQGYAFFQIKELLNAMEEAEGTDKVWSGARIKSYLVNEAYRGDILTHKWVKLDYLAGKQVPNKGQEEQFYLEQHHEPLVDTEVFDTVQEYVKKGYLNTQNGKLRKNWLMENRDILNRRRNQKHDE